jgi:diguanylate cyclase (GGDEF)-like protein/PAS domain S-box-containing protein
MSFPADQKQIKILALFILSIAGILIYTIVTLRQHDEVSRFREVAYQQKESIDRYLQEIFLMHQGVDMSYQLTGKMLTQSLEILKKHPVQPEIASMLEQQEMLLGQYQAEAENYLQNSSANPRKLLLLRNNLSAVADDIASRYEDDSDRLLSSIFRLEIVFGALITLLGLFLMRQVTWSEGKLKKESADRKAAEQAVKLLERSIATTQIGITITDPSGKITYVNPAEAQMHGYSIDDLVGKDVRIFAPPERWETTTMEQIKDMNYWRRESVNIRKDGTTFPVQLMSDVIMGADNEPIGIVTTCEDITERKQAEQTLRESELRFRSVAESAVDGLVLVDGSGNIIFWNHVAEKIFGYSEKEIRNESFALLLPEPERDVQKETIEKIIASAGGGISGRRFELEAARKDGRRFPLELSIGAWQAGDQKCYTAVVRDITRKKQSEKQLRESEELYRNLVETARDIIATIALDGTITSLNAAFEKITGWTREEWIGRNFEPLIHPDDRAGAFAYFAKVQQGIAVPIAELRLMDKNNACRVVESKAVVQIKEGKVIGILTIARDVTRRKKAEEELAKYREQLEELVETRTAELTEANQKLQLEITERMRVESALRDSEERYVLAVRGAQDGLWDWNLDTNQIYFSPRWKWMLGYGKEEIGSGPEEWFQRIHPEDLEKVKVEIFAHIEGLTKHFENEHRMLQKDGTYRWILSRGLAVRDATGKAYRFAGSQTDIVERKLIEEKLAKQAFYDPLTQLPNRALFMDRLGQALKRANRRRDYLFALLYLDLDHFKEINDTMGHLLGDQLLVAVARKLEECLRPSDTVARQGGDEFTILLDDIKDLSDATHIADRIWKELSSAFYLGGREVTISASIGIALSSKGYERPEQVLQDADTALYRAKDSGRARHEVFS